MGKYTKGRAMNENSGEKWKKTDVMKRWTNAEKV